METSIRMKSSLTAIRSMGKLLPVWPMKKKKLRSMLDQEAATVLDRMICLQAAIAGMTAEEYFIDGLRTGFRLALAILDEEENGLLKPISDGGKQP